jgi:glycosyltransferase involved in cell wall biosynthesis
MRIALVCHRFHPHFGGVELHVREIAERLAKNNDVAVFALEDGVKSDAKEMLNGVAIKRFKPIRLSEAIRIPPMVLVNEIRSFNPDVIHVHNIHSLMPYFAAKANVRGKLLFTPHYVGSSLTRFRRMLFQLYKPSLTRVMRQSERIICISDVEKRMLLHDFKIDQRKIIIIPNGVDHELTAIKPMRNDFRILSVGRLDLVHKKTDKLIRAFKLIENNVGGKLVLIGDGPDKEKVRALINKLGLKDRIELKSNLTKSQLFDEYARASLFVMASENETYGIVVAEALAAGLKVVIPNASGLALFVNDGYATGIDPPITPEKIAENILNSLQAKSDNLRKFMPQTWDMIASSLSQVYLEVAS